MLDLVKTAACAGAMMAVLAVLPRWGIGVADLAIRSVTGVAIYGALAWLLNLNSVREIIHQRLIKKAAA